ncbi:acetyl-CoA carboxylase carboxyltransferase subunit beta [bacterium]|nr:acetyl-CoA carboxylase carboxyltransferase subunit beta [bacterium]
MPLFGKPRYSAIKVKKVQIPTGRWMKCTNCREIIDARAFHSAYKTCPKCKFHYKMSARERVDLLLDEGSLDEMDSEMLPQDPLGFVDSKKYTDRHKQGRAKSKLNEAILTGMGSVAERPVGFGAMDFSYIGGSMGSVVGEKVTRLVERCLDQRCVLIIVTASGGARMMESTYSLMQMAKTSGALSRLHKEGLAYIAVLCNPTTGGVTASFASLGDIIIAEPGALIGFAGPRVIEQTIRQELPEGFQRSEFLLEHGMIDMIVPRKELREKLQELVTFFSE